MKKKKATVSYDDIEYRLSADQVNSLILFFNEYTTKRGLLFEDCYDHFMSGSHTFAMFLINLEKKQTWFDYTQVEEVMSIVDILIKKMPR